MNLDSMSLDELKKLSKDVTKAISSFESRRRKDALKAMELAAKEFGMSVEEVIGAPKTKAAKTKAPAKYRNPADPSQTWSGKGRQPGWYKDAIKAGKSEKSLLV